MGITEARPITGAAAEQGQAARSRPRGQGPSGRTLFVSTYVPTECGLATFTHDLANAVDEAAERPRSCVAAIRPRSEARDPDGRVVHVIDNNEDGAYGEAAHFINGSDCDVVSLQHEFGLYPGECGESVLDMVRNCRKPVVTTFHTLSLSPDLKSWEVVRELAFSSEGVVVMTEFSRRILKQVYDVPVGHVARIPHGVHRSESRSATLCREALGLGQHPVVLSFGLLGRGKGIEVGIQALPAIVRRYPKALFIVAGRTHPRLVEWEGERYRQELMQLAQGLDVSENVRFVDKYLTRDEMAQLMACADVVLTPYRSKQQVVSGVLSTALAAGKAVVATPYLHAEEMWGKGALLLTGFDDPAGTARQVLRVLDEPQMRNWLQRRALDVGRDMYWDRVGARYVKLFERAGARVHG